MRPLPLQPEPISAILAAAGVVLSLDDGAVRRGHYAGVAAMTGALDEKTRKDLAEPIALKRIGTVDDVAGVAVQDRADRLPGAR